MIEYVPLSKDEEEQFRQRHWVYVVGTCEECGEKWPCPTVRLLDELAVLRGERVRGRVRKGG